MILIEKLEFFDKQLLSFITSLTIVTKSYILKRYSFFIFCLNVVLIYNINALSIEKHTSLNIEKVENLKKRHNFFKKCKELLD